MPAGPAEPSPLGTQLSSAFLPITSPLLLGLALAAPAVAQPAKDTETYKISNVLDARARSAIAATGADVFEVGHDYVLVEATPREARALKRLGLALQGFKTQADFLKVFPTADSAYHDYAEMVAELEQAAFDHPAIFSLFSLGTSHEGRTIWAGKISGEGDASIATLHQAVRENPRRAETHLFLAVAYRRLGRNEEARKEDEILRNLAPTSVAAE